MLGNLKSLDARLLSRRCVGCGYDGALLRGGQARRCARCGCDLTQRPARSYAEMEGLLGHPMMIETPVWRPQQFGTLTKRWMAVLFCWAALLGAIACLFVAAIGAV